jgi:hypothetical protein
MVVYLYKKGRQTMKNIITTIAMFILTITVQAQAPQYENVHYTLDSVMTANKIFYVGAKDRKDEVQLLDSFQKVYSDGSFYIIPDVDKLPKLFDKTNIKYETIGDESQANNYFDNSDVMGYKTFDLADGSQLIVIEFSYKLPNYNSYSTFGLVKEKGSEKYKVIDY